MKIKTIETDQGSLDAFVKKVSRALSRTELGKVTEVQRGDGEILITFSGLSKSTIVYKVEEREGENGFTARFEKEDISFIHKALRGKVEIALADIMGRLGAKISD